MAQERQAVDINGDGKMNKAKRILITYSNNGASALYRVHEPYRNLQVEGCEFYIQNTFEDESGQGWDAVLLQQPTQPFILEAIKDFQKKGVKVILETDDDFLSISKSNPVSSVYKASKEFLETYKKCLDHVDYIHCSTPELKESIIKQVGRYEDEISVFYNAVDLKKYEGKVKHKNPEPVIMWAGSSASHMESIKIIAPMIKRLLKDYMVVLVSNPTWLKANFSEHKNLKIIPYMPMENYFVMPSLADVFLTPIPNDLFSKSKSELKCIEAGVFGVPCVSSPVAPYKRFSKLSDGGNLLGNFMDNIYELLNNDDLYSECSEKSKKAVETIYNLDVVNEQRKKFWEKIL